MALMPVAEALRLVLIEAKPLPVETVPLDRARGRVLAVDMAALRTQPPACQFGGQHDLAPRGGY